MGAHQTFAKNMKIISTLTLTGAILLLSCDEVPASRRSPTNKLAVKESQILTPSDLGVTKYDFSCYPSEDEVAVFRVETIKPGKKTQTYDQISYTIGQGALNSVCLIRKSVYVDYPSDPSGAPVDRWSIHAGLFHYDINGKIFSRASWEGSRGVGQIEFSNDRLDVAPDLVFKVSMLIMKYDDAKKVHPKLPLLEKGHSWGAAYLVELPSEQAVDGNPH